MHNNKNKFVIDVPYSRISINRILHWEEDRSYISLSSRSTGVRFVVVEISKILAWLEFFIVIQQKNIYDNNNNNNNWEDDKFIIQIQIQRINEQAANSPMHPLYFSCGGIYYVRLRTYHASPIFLWRNFQYIYLPSMMLE